MKIEIAVLQEMAFDVAVVGGGTAGVFAAIAAARTGAKTVLVEKNSILGGTVTVGGVNFPGLFHAWGEQIVAGPCWEAIERTAALGGANLPVISYHPQHHWDEQVLVSPFVFTSVLFEMCRESGVEVIGNAMLTAVSETAEGVTLAVTCKEGVSLIKAAVAIDATGDANLCQMAGLSVVKSEEQQPATLQNHLVGYTLNEEIREDVVRRFPDADLPACVTAADLVSYLHQRKINLHVPCVDADTSRGKTSLESRTFADMLRVYRFYKGIHGLENMQLALLASETGVRETNRVVGEHIITAEEYINGQNYADAVCYAFYPIDLHVMHGIEQTFHQEGVVSKIPYRALIPQGAAHILCAGRCISSDTYANSAVRVQAVCMATGQAAGCAAAIAAKSRACVAEVPYAALRDALHTIGAIVPK